MYPTLPENRAVLNAGLFYADWQHFEQANYSKYPIFYQDRWSSDPYCYFGFFVLISRYLIFIF